jgi:hypothetical protein
MQPTGRAVKHPRHDAKLIPPSSRYVAALEKLAPRLTARRLKMIRAHYRAPGRTLTATQLAKAAGYKNYRAVNLQYGLIGAKLAALMAWKVPEGAQASYACAAFYRTDAEEDWRWEMHPAFAEALKKAELV